MTHAHDSSAERDELQPTALAYLSERYVMALATDGPEGLWVASVYFAGGLTGNEVRLYFLSSPGSRHSRNLAENPRVAAAINEDQHDWQAIRGLQLEGECHAVTSFGEYLRGWRAYCTKFPFVRDLFRRTKAAKLEEGMAGKLLRTQMYCLRVSQMYYLDNRRGFGQRRQVFGPPSD